LSKQPEPADDPIKAAAASAAAAVENVDEQERLAQLEERIAKLEPLLEAREQDQKFNTVFTEYVSSLKDEQSFLKTARWAFGILAFGTILLLAAVLGLAIFCESSPLLKNTTPPASVAIFVVGMFSAIAFLVGGVLKGLLRSASERHADGFMPPQIEEALKLHDRLNGKS
jgi:hypothetical protein